MASIVIRDLDEGLRARLRVRAAHHGRSVEEEARDILRIVLADEGSASPDLAEALRPRFAVVGGVNLSEAPREPMREPPAFER